MFYAYIVRVIFLFKILNNAMLHMLQHVMRIDSITYYFLLFDQIGIRLTLWCLVSEVRI